MGLNFFFQYNYCNLEYREMVVKILLLYSNGNMLAQKFELWSDRLCILVSNRDLTKIQKQNSSFMII